MGGAGWSNIAGGGVFPGVYHEIAEFHLEYVAEALGGSLHHFDEELDAGEEEKALFVVVLDELVECLEAVFEEKFVSVSVSSSLFFGLSPFVRLTVAFWVLAIF